MKFTYDKQANVLYIKLSENQIADSEEKEPNLIIDFDNGDNVVGIEISYFVKKYRKDVLPAFKEVEKTV
jgi:uncharacterized protein YuzE